MNKKNDLIYVLHRYNTDVVVVAAQLCEHVKNHYIVPFKWVNCIVWELYLNKAV